MDAVLNSLFVFALAIAPVIGALALLSWISSKLIGLLGRPLTLTMGFIAVPVHELSHLVIAKLCGHKIQKVSLFWPTPDGRLGYVEHSFHRRWYTPLSLLLIGLAPLAGGALAVYLATYFLVPSVLALMSGIQIDSVSIWLDSVRLVLSALSGEPWYKSAAWCWLMLSFLLFAVPSKSDFKGCTGAVVAAAVLFVLIGALSPDSLITVAAAFRLALGFMVAPLLSGAGVVGIFVVLAWLLIQLKGRFSGVRAE